MIALFASFGPIGIGLGWAISNSCQLLNSIFLAIAAGFS